VSPPRQLLANVVTVLAVPPALLTLFGRCGSWHWLADQCSHFPAQYGLSLLLAAVVLLLARRWRTALLLLAFAAVDGWQLVPLFTATPPQGAAGGGQVRAMHSNVMSDNDDHATLLATIRAAAPDFFAACEVTPAWQRSLDTLRDLYPHAITHATDDCFGIVLYSRHPLRDAAVIPLGFAWAPAIRAVVQTPHGDLGVLAVHTPRPGDRRNTMQRDQALAAIGSAIAPLPAARLVIGDLNVTRWSAPFQDLLFAAQLHDTADGAGWQPTWPTDVPSLLRIPIDQALVSSGIGVTHRRVGPYIGSDHLPLVVDLVLPAAQ